MKIFKFHARLYPTSPVGTFRESRYLYVSGILSGPAVHCETTFSNCSQGNISRDLSINDFSMSQRRDYVVTGLLL